MNKEATNKKEKSLKDLHKEFLRVQKYIEGKSLKTLKNYQDSFNLLMQFKPGTKCGDLIPKTMVDFSEWLMTRKKKIGKEMIVKPCKASTIISIRRRLLTFFEWLDDQKYIDYEPLKKMPYPRINDSSGRAFTKEEYDKIYLAVSRDIPWENRLLRVRNMAIIMVLFHTGIRRGGLLGLRMCDIDMKRRVIFARGEMSKSKRDNRIPMSNELISYLKEYLNCRSDYETEAFWVSNRGDQPFTTHGLKHFTERLKKTTGIKPLRIHDFRHTFACNYYVQSIHDAKGLQKIMGHRDIKTTYNVYLKSLPDDDIAKQMKGFSSPKFQ